MQIQVWRNRRGPYTPGDKSAEDTNGSSPKTGGSFGPRLRRKVTKSDLAVIMPAEKSSYYSPRLSRAAESSGRSCAKSMPPCTMHDYLPTIILLVLKSNISSPFAQRPRHTGGARFYGEFGGRDETNIAYSSTRRTRDRGLARKVASRRLASRRVGLCRPYPGFISVNSFATAGHLRGTSTVKEGARRKYESRSNDFSRKKNFSSKHEVYDFSNLLLERSLGK